MKKLPEDTKKLNMLVPAYEERVIEKMKVDQPDRSTR